MLKAFVLLSVIQVICGLPTNGTPANGTIFAEQADGPWTVLLMIRGTRCTGSLIKNKYVVTAAHCFDDLEDIENLQNKITIFIGEWKTNMDPDCTDSDEDIDDICIPIKVTEIPAKKLTIHPEYIKKKDSFWSQKYAYDIAIIELKRSPRASPIIQSIALPNKDTCEDQPDHPLFVTGFGEIKSKHYTNTKKIMYINLYDQNTCRRKIGSHFNSEKHFCGIGPNNVATCKGDTGGPIANIIDGVPTLQGVVSYETSRCGDGHIPSAFLRVACFIDWINEHMNQSPPTVRTTVRRRTICNLITRTRTTTTTTEANDSSFEEDDPFAK